MDHYWNAAGHRETYFWASVQTTMQTDWYPVLCKQMIRCCFNVLFKLSFSCLHLLVWKCSGTFASASNWNTLLLYVWKHGRHQSGNPSGYRPDDDLASGYPWNNGYLETLSAARLTARYVRRMRETFQLISINKYLRMNADTCLWAYNQCVTFQLLLRSTWSYLHATKARSENTIWKLTNGNQNLVPLVTEPGFICRYPCVRLNIKGNSVANYPRLQNLETLGPLSKAWKYHGAEVFWFSSLKDKKTCK